MKTLIATLIVALAATVLGQASPPRNTADWYLLEPEKHENKRITLYVSHVNQWRYEGPAIPEGFRPLTLWTAYQGNRGGYINAFIHESHYARVVRDYGTKPKYNAQNQILSRRMVPIFYKWEIASGHVTWIVVLPAQ